MDRKTGQWVAGFFERAVAEADYKPGVTIEIVEQPGLWVQVVPQLYESKPGVSGFMVNFPYRQGDDEPLAFLEEAGITPPPKTTVIEWEAGGYATLLVHPDVPLIPLALFTGEILEVIGAQDGEYTVQYEYGY